MMRHFHGDMKARVPDNGTWQDMSRQTTSSNEQAQRLDNLPIANAAAAADENASVGNCWDTIQSQTLAVLGRASRHLQPALRERPTAKSLHRPPHRRRRRQQSSILPLPPRDAERTDGSQVYRDPRVRGPQQMEEDLYHPSNLLSARQRQSGGIRPERKTALVAREQVRYKVDIATLRETKIFEQGQLEEVGVGYTFFWSGRPRTKRRDAGVTFAIRNDIVVRPPCLPQGINDRLMSLRFPLSGGEITNLVSIYPPPMSSPAETRNKFYAELHAVLASELTTCNELAQRLDNLSIAGAAAEENGSVENCWDTIQSQTLAVLGRASRHLQPALRGGPPAESINRPPNRRRQQSSILPLPPPCATAATREAERTGDQQVYGDPRERGPHRMEERLLRHQSNLLSARQRGVLNRPSNISDTAIARPPQVETKANLDLPRSLHETIGTVQQISSGKAPASVASSAEVYKHDFPQFMEHLTALFQEMWL
nr:unnamed protein product [Spirometra erinaceieuropaei]